MNHEQRVVEAVAKIRALRQLTRETGTLTTRSQNKLLQSLNDDEMVLAAVELTKPVIN